MRAVFAAATALLVLLTAMAPHAHDGASGRTACVACVTASGEEAVCATPAMAPRALATDDLPDLTLALPAGGFPLGAVPGQSPPFA